MKSKQTTARDPNPMLNLIPTELSERDSLIKSTPTVFRGMMKKGYKVPSKIQRKSIPLILSGADVVTMAPTGSKKTDTFLVPILQKLQQHLPGSSVWAQMPNLTLAAVGKSSANLGLLFFQSKMKSDMGGYYSGFYLIIRGFDLSLDLFCCHSTLNLSSDPSIAKEVDELAMFLTHVSPFYSSELLEFPRKVADLLREDGRGLPSVLRGYLAQALILLVNRKVVDMFLDNQMLYNHVTGKWMVKQCKLLNSINRYSCFNENSMYATYIWYPLQC